ncbi:UPF0481 protein At3g47200 [Linum grandiflorum]
MARTNWVVEITEKLQTSATDDPSEDQESHWKKQSIYKIPLCVTDLNKKAYKPQSVSFGPYHHGRDHLRPMEQHKQRALLHFLRRANKPLQAFVDAISEVVDVLRDSYSPLEGVWKEEDQKEEFLKLMIVDGCFMLEVLRIGTHTLDDYATNDPIFSGHGRLYIMPYIRRDMLMLENQLHMVLLDKLIEVESNGTKDEEFVNKLIQKFCLPNTHVARLGKCKHVIDAYRKSILHQDEIRSKKVGPLRRRRPPRYRAEDDIVRSATELHEAGIQFKRSITGSLKDISFRRGVLRLPVVVVDDTTEFIFLNLIAYERFHVGAGNEVTSYIFFMDKIIDSERDVALLTSKGIIQNAVGSDKAVAKLFNSMSRDITLDPESSLEVVHKRVSAYCRKPWNEWRANLIHTYFRNPWAILSLVAAFFLFALTIAQTIYTIYPYYHSDAGSADARAPTPRVPVPSRPR